MPARKTKAPRKKALKTKLKQDPIGTMKGEVNKTGALKYPIGAYILGAIGGAGIATALQRVPVVCGILSVMASKGAKLTSGFNK